MNVEAQPLGRYRLTNGFSLTAPQRDLPPDKTSKYSDSRFLPFMLRCQEITNEKLTALNLEDDDVRHSIVSQVISAVHWYQMTHPRNRKNYLENVFLMEPPDTLEKADGSSDRVLLAHVHGQWCGRRTFKITSVEITHVFNSAQKAKPLYELKNLAREDSPCLMSDSFRETIDRVFAADNKQYLTRMPASGQISP